MPTKTPLENTLIPNKHAPDPIPVRVVATRSQKPKTAVGASPEAAPQTQKQENGNQATQVVSDPVAASATTEESVKLSPHLSAIAKREQASRQRETELKRREKEIAEDLELAREYKELKTKLSSKDFSAAEKLGLNYDEYTQFLLNKQDSEDPKAQELQGLKSEVAGMKKSLEEKAQQEFDSTVAEYRKEIAAAVESNPEFSSIKVIKDAQEAVLQFILDSWEEDSLEVSIEDACKEIENELIVRAKAFSSLPKLKPAEVVEERKLPPPKTGVKTVTNQMLPAGNEAKPTKPLHLMSDAERYAEARRRVLARRENKG